MHTTLTPDARTCADRFEGEPLPEYASRVLRYAITYGVTPLTLSQLELADATAQQVVASFATPETLSPDDQRQDAAMHALRLRLHARMAQKRQQLAQLQRLIDQAYLESQQPANASQSAAGTAEMSDQERALQLLRAALTLIMQPPPPGDGGKGARLIAPKPTQPPSGNALQAPTQAPPRRF